MYGHGNYGDHFPHPPPPPPLRPPNTFQTALPPPPYPPPQPPPPHFLPPSPAPPAPYPQPPAMQFLPPPPSSYPNTLPPPPPPPPHSSALPPGQPISCLPVPPPHLHGPATSGLYRHPPPPPPGIQHVPAPPPPSLNPPPFTSFLRGPGDVAMPPPVPPPSPPPPPPASPPPPPPASPPPPVPPVEEEDIPSGEVGGGYDGSGRATMEENRGSDLSPPPMKPSDDVVRSIDTLCRFISKVGPHFEDVARSKEANNPQFAFLFGGEPGSDAAVGYEYFRWMRKKCLLEPRPSTSPDYLSERLSETMDSPLASEERAAGHTDSDMDMEDDADNQPNREIVECHQEYVHTGVSEEKATCFVYGGETQLNSSDTISQRQSDFSGKKSVIEESDSGRPVIPAIHPDKALLSFPGNGSEEASRVYVKNGSPFRQIQDYASDESSGDDLGNCFISDVSPVRVSPPSLNFTSTSCEVLVESLPDQGNKDDIMTGLQIDDQLIQSHTVICKEVFTPSASSPARPEQTSLPLAMSEHTSNPPARSEQTSLHLDSTMQIEGASTCIKSVNRLCSVGESFEEFQQNDSVDLVDGQTNDQVGSHQTDTCTNVDSGITKVDEFGRIVREGVTESESDESPSKRRDGKRVRNWSRSRSPPNVQRSRSPRRRVDKRSRSRSFSPKRRRRRSNSPAEHRRPNDFARSNSPTEYWRSNDFARSNSPSEYRRANDFGRRERGDPPRCIHFMRGRCFRGSSCWFLHTLPGEHRAKSNQQRGPFHGSDKYARDGHLIKENDSGRRMPGEANTLEYGRSSLDVGRDQLLPLGHDRSMHVEADTLEYGKSSLDVRRDQLLPLGLDRSVHIIEDDTLKYGKSSLDVGQDQPLLLEHDRSVHVEADRSEYGISSLDVGRDRLLRFDDDKSVHVEDDTLKYGKSSLDVDHEQLLPLGHDRSVHVEDDTLMHAKSSLDVGQDQLLPLGGDRNVPVKDDTFAYGKSSLDVGQDQLLPLGHDRSVHDENCTLAYGKNSLEVEQDQLLPSVSDSDVHVEDDTLEYGKNSFVEPDQLPLSGSGASMLEEANTVEYDKSSLDVGHDQLLSSGHDLSDHNVQVLEVKPLDEKDSGKLSSSDDVEAVALGTSSQSPSSMGVPQDQFSDEQIQQIQPGRESESIQDNLKEANSAKLDEVDHCPVLYESPQTPPSLDIVENETGPSLECPELTEPSVSLPLPTSTSPLVENHEYQQSEGPPIEITESAKCENMSPGIDNESVRTFEVQRMQLSSGLSCIDQHVSVQIPLERPPEHSTIRNELPPSGFPSVSFQHRPYVQNLPSTQHGQPLHQLPFTPVTTQDRFPPVHTSHMRDFRPLNEPPRAPWANTSRPEHFVEMNTQITSRTDFYQPQFAQQVLPYKNEFHNQNDARHHLRGDPNHPGSVSISQYHGYGGHRYIRDEQLPHRPLLASQPPHGLPGSYSLGFSNSITQDTRPSFQPLGFNNKLPGSVLYPTESSSLRVPQPAYNMQYSSALNFSVNQSTANSIDSSILRRPLDFPEKRSGSWMVNAGMPITSAAPHYNPFASTFEEVKGPQHGSSYSSSQLHFAEHRSAGVSSAQSEPRGAAPPFARAGGQAHTPMSGVASHHSYAQEPTSIVPSDSHMRQNLETSYHTYAQEPTSVVPSDSHKRQNLETSTGDQYDPLLDSLETSNVAKKSGYILDKVAAAAYPDKSSNAGAFPVTSIQNDEVAETAMDAEVGTVENLSPMLADADDFPNPASGEIDIDKIASPEKTPVKSKKSKDSRSMKLFKLAIANFVKEILKPSWRQGNMSKEAFKTIVKKTVEKVSSTVPNNHIPKSQAKINSYVESSQRKLIKLVNGYVEKYVKM